MAEQAAGQIVNSAGTLVTAILESVGYHYQSAILDKLTTPLTDEVGALIYIFGIALAVLMTATQGQYKMGVWLLIGPPLFFASILPRGEIGNAAWRFGRQVRDDAAVDKGEKQTLEAAGQPSAGNAKVSKLFAAFVKMVSVTQQEIVNVITSNRKEADLALVVRAELFGQIHISRFNKPGLERLFHAGMIGNCGQALEFARAMNDPLYRPAQFGNPNRGVIDATPEGQEAKKFFENRRQYFEGKFKEFAKNPQQNLDGKEAELIASTKIQGGGDALANQVDKEQIVPYNCYQIWEALIYYIQEQSGQDLERILSRGAQIGVKRQSIVNIALQAEGKKIDKPITNNGDDTTLSANDILAVKRIIAKYLLRNEFRRDSWGSRVAYWITGMETQDVRLRFAGKESFTEQARTAAQEWSEKERMINAAASIPYYQGLALFLMSAVFPFFALLLLIPGKQAGFFLWFTVWIWLKSWDVAMAIVMLLDDVVFSMLSVQMQNRQGGVQGQNELDNFAMAFSTINEMDPTFQLSTYYSIIATAMLAIPPTTAHLILGGLKGGAGLISAGMNRNALQASSQFLGAVEQNAVNALRNDFLDVKRQRIAEYEDNVKQGKSAHAGVRDELGRLVRPADGNPVKTAAYSTGAFYARKAVPEPKRPGQNGQSLYSSPASGELSARMHGNLIDAGRSGAGAGYTSPSARFGKIGNQALVDAIARTGTAADRHYGGLYKANTATLESEYNAVAAQAVWDSEIEPLQMYRVNMMSVMGALAIPSPNFALAYAGAEAHDKFLLSQFNEKMERSKADWAFKGDVARNVRETLSYVLNSVYDQKRGNAEGFMGLGSMDAETAKAVKADYKKFAGKDGKVDEITNEQLRTMTINEKTRNFVMQRFKTQSDAFQSIGTVVAGTEVFSSTWMQKVGQQIYSPIFGYGDQKQADLIGPQDDPRLNKAKYTSKIPK